MFVNFLRTKNYLLTIALCVGACAISGCVESTFTLADESPMPRSMTLPPKLKRTNVSVTLNLYAAPQGTDAELVLTDRKGKKLREMKAKMEEVAPSMYKLTFPENSLTEIVMLKPYKEHENMEQNGVPVARFYLVDDPSLVR